MKGLVFVTTPGSNIARKDNNLLITSKDGSYTLPIGAIEHLFLFNGVNITTPALRFVVSHNKLLFFVNQFGKLSAVAMPEPIGSDYRVRLAQYEMLSDKKKKFAVIKMLLETKAKNIGYIMGLDESEYNRRVYINALKSRVVFKDLNAALGIDGNLNYSMFEFFRNNMLPEGFEFDLRQYHPPKDPVNALLSLVYTIYYSLLIPLAVAEGFDPYIGFFHVKRGRHAAFCSDIIEISRPWLTLFVFRLLDEGFFDPSDFEIKNSGCTLKQKALKAYLKVFTERVVHKGDFFEYSQEFLKRLKEEIVE